jgi:hypothetical protein
VRAIGSDRDPLRWLGGDRRGEVAGLASWHRLSLRMGVVILDVHRPGAQKDMTANGVETLEAKAARVGRLNRPIMSEGLRGIKNQTN